MHRQIYFLLFFLLMQPSIFFGSEPEITSIFPLGGQVIGASDKRGAQVEDRIEQLETYLPQSIRPL